MRVFISLITLCVIRSTIHQRKQILLAAEYVYIPYMYVCAASALIVSFVVIIMLVSAEYAVNKWFDYVIVGKLFAWTL